MSRLARLACLATALACGGSPPSGAPSSAAPGRAEEGSRAGGRALATGSAGAPAPRRAGGGPTGAPGAWASLPPRRPSVEDRRAPSVATLEAASRALEEGYYETVEAFLRGQLGDAAARLLLSRLLFETGRLDEALGVLDLAAASTPARADALVLRAEILADRGRLDAAERALREATAARRAPRALALLGRLLVRRGRRAEGEAELLRVIDAYNDGSIGERDAEGLAAVGVAAHGLGAFQDANDAFMQSAEARASGPDAERVLGWAQLEWARLFLEKNDLGHAEESVALVLGLNPRSAEALSLRARIVLAQSFDFAEADELARRALAVRPGHVPALVTLAGMNLRDLDFAGAHARLDEALAIDPTDLEALSVRAAVRFLEGDARAFEAAKAAVLRVNPTYSRMYATIAEYADWEHRYPDLVRMSREALALDPDDPLAHATLGLNLLRTGDEDGGLAALREAWRRDHFNVYVYNTLNLYDDVIRRDYEDVAAPPFLLRVHRDERQVLERLVPPTLRRAYDDMRRRYRLTPEGPLRIELYATEEHFAVRTSGLPRIGVQGVCFGKVVTALSPRGGPYNWGQITWHELSHVFHIQLSRNRVPRWFTEGLAEYETSIARAHWRREDDGLLARALAAGTLPPLRLLNRAFTHARSPEGVMTAYYASYRAVAYIVERYGFPKVVDMLSAWGRGLPSDEVVRQALGVGLDALDAGFRQAEAQRLASRPREFVVDLTAALEVPQARASALAAPDDASKQAEYAVALLAAGDGEAAKGAADRAIARAPDEPRARYVLARVALASGEPARAEEHLRQILATGRDGYELRMLLARLAAARRDPPGVRRELEAAVALDAERVEAWHGLMEVGEQTHDPALARRALFERARLDQHDRDANLRVLQILSREGRTAELAARAEDALYVDPHNPAVQRLLPPGQATAP